MPKISEHCQDCIDDMGEAFEKVHVWLDELSVSVGIADHRDVRHNIKGVEKVREMWGDKAAKAAEIHIRKDEGCIPEIDLPFKLRLEMKPHVKKAYEKEYGEYHDHGNYSI